MGTVWSPREETEELAEFGLTRLKSPPEIGYLGQDLRFLISYRCVAWASLATSCHWSPPLRCCHGLCGESAFTRRCHGEEGIYSPSTFLPFEQLQFLRGTDHLMFWLDLRGFGDHNYLRLGLLNLNQTAASRSPQKVIYDGSPHKVSLLLT